MKKENINVFLTPAQDWSDMQDALQNSVVQVIAQIASYNWLEPYTVEEQHESRGTGFFIDPEGYFITNAHVVNEATTVWIHLPTLGKKTFLADIVSFCPDRDLALLKIRDADLIFLREQLGEIVPLPFGDSDQIRRTDDVLVLGYPLGDYNMKSSTGVISGREYGEGRSMIQITAPINPGNSGGPLINTQGEVIGIAISVVFMAQNIGYAIPINELKIVLADLYKNKFVRRGFLGARFNYSTDELATYLGNPLPAGFYINKVFDGSLMEKAGVQSGDMLYEFNGFILDAFGETVAPWSREKIVIHDLVARLKHDEPLTLVVYRKGKKHVLACSFTVTTPNPIRVMHPNYEKVEYEIIGGMVVMQLCDNHLLLLDADVPDLVQYEKMENKTKPVLVITHIIPGSEIQQLRSIVPGFVITQINGQDVTTLEEFRKALHASIASDILTIKTSEDIFVVVPFKKTLEDEARLAKNFSYPISATVKELIAKIGKHKA